MLGRRRPPAIRSRRRRQWPVVNHPQGPAFPCWHHGHLLSLSILFQRPCLNSFSCAHSLHSTTHYSTRSLPLICLYHRMKWDTDNTQTRGLVYLQMCWLLHPFSSLDMHRSFSFHHNCKFSNNAAAFLLGMRRINVLRFRTQLPPLMLFNIDLQSNTADRWNVPSISWCKCQVDVVSEYRRWRQHRIRGRIASFRVRICIPLSLIQTFCIFVKQWRCGQEYLGRTILRLLMIWLRTEEAWLLIVLRSTSSMASQVTEALDIGLTCTD